jgi:2-oxoisovalerate dehydrogenase E1 component
VAATGELLTLAQGINRALAEILEQNADALLFGQDVARKGGVYGVTKGLLERFGALRVFDTLLDEQTILGLALGAATLGMLPIAEIQYLAYLHNAEDQLRGEASTFRFFSNGAFENPMLVRIAGFAYQKGFGGHFHNDNALAVLRDIPGLVVCVPARADDAFALYRSALDLARRGGRVVVVIEPIALYHRRELRDGDTGWLAADSGQAAEFCRARIYRPEAGDLTIVTYGNGVRLSLAAAERLSRQHRIEARVLDLRWLAPLPEACVLDHARATGRVLLVDECRHSGGVSEALAAMLLENAAGAACARVTSADCFIPLGDAAELVLVSVDEIVAAARSLQAKGDGL